MKRELKLITSESGLSETVEFIIHDIDGEVSEVYVVWNDMEIVFDYDIDGAMEKTEAFFRQEILIRDLI